MITNFTFDFTYLNGEMTVFSLASFPVASTNEFIPWHNTHSLSKGISALNRMYDSLPQNSALKLFLNSHCLHLLSPLKGHTGIPVSYAYNIVLNELPEVVNLGKKFNPTKFVSLSSNVGVYVLFFVQDKGPTQCGSSIAFHNRVRTYYYQAAKEHSLFSIRPIHEFKWVPVKYNNNYVNMFNVDNPMSPEQELILTSFTQQEIRSLEQAYSTFVVPSNYKFINVSTWHNNWHEGDTGHTYTAKRIYWITENGTVHTRNSIDAGVLELGFSHKHVRNVANLKNGTLDTAKYGKVTVHIDGFIKGLTYDKRYGTPINTFVETSGLKPNDFYF